MMQVRLKFKVRSRFMQFWDCKKKTTVRKMIGKMVLVLLVFGTMLMIIVLSFQYCNNYRGRGTSLIEIIL
jgi:hypothetical protein